MDSEKNTRSKNAGTKMKYRLSPASRAASPSKLSAPSGTTAGMGLTAEQRHDLIAKAAYLRAERRGFQGGSPEQDWLEAEAEIDASLLRLRGGDV